MSTVENTTMLPSGIPAVIEGRYRVVRAIAEGGMATVYEAVDERLGRTVAIKVMHLQLTQGPHRNQFVERFRREANAAASIANPHIVQVYDTGEFNGLDFLVMEYVHGVNLRHEMNQQHTFSVRETLHIVAETLDGLAAAHRAGVVHRDIKPENILINDRGHVQITDFGLAKATSQATLSSTGMLLGTAAYLAPETIEHNQALPQGDLYSVGIMAWEMLAGSVPFASDNPVTLVFKHVHEDVPSVTVPCPDVDPKVAAFISRLTARDAADRPADASVAAEELRTLSQQLDDEAWAYRLNPQDDAETPAESLAAVVERRANNDASNASDVNANATNAAPNHDENDDTVATPIASHTTSASSAAAAPAASTISSAAPTQAASTTDPVAPTTTIDHFVPSGEQTQILPKHQLNDPTQALTLQENGELAVDTPTDANGKPKRHVNKKKVAILSTILALLAALAGVGCWWWFIGPGSYWTVPQPTDVTCSEGSTCSLTGASWDDYESTLKVANIPYEQQDDYSDTVATGKIIAAEVGKSDVQVGSHVGKHNGDKLTVLVSKGIKMVTVPSDILDSTSANGKDPLTALKNAGFDNIVHDENNDDYSLDVPTGSAISVSPNPGTTIKHSDKITVVLSKGLKPVTMPNIVGMSKDDMQRTFDDLKLTANITEEYSDSVDSGTVISASQSEGAELHWGDSVDVVISKGPETVKMPNVVGQKYDDAAATLEALGLQVKKSSPLGEWYNTVRLQSASAGSNVRLRDKDGNPTVITLTVV